MGGAFAIIPLANVSAILIDTARIVVRGLVHTSTHSVPIVLIVPVLSVHPATPWDWTSTATAVVALILAVYHVISMGRCCLFANGGIAASDCHRCC